MSNRKMVYIAHYFKGLPENVEKCGQLILFLIKKFPDITFFSPLHATGFFYFEKSYDEGMKDCIEFLSRCDELWLAPGWEKSHGANIEKKWAEENGKPVHEIMTILADMERDDRRRRSMGD